MSTCQLDGKVYKEVVKKKYDGKGQLVETADARGVTKNRYDHKGNRLSSQGPDGGTEYIYGKNNNLKRSRSWDYKSGR